MRKLTADVLSALSMECPFPEIFRSAEPAKSGIVSYPRCKIGHIRADYDGWRWHNTIWPCHDELATAEMKREIDNTYTALTAKDAFCDLQALRQFCMMHPNAYVGASGTEYSFYLEGVLCYYWLRIITRERDYNMYLNAYAKGKELI